MPNTALTSVAISMEAAIGEQMIQSMAMYDPEKFQQEVKEVQGMLEPLLSKMIKQYGNVEVPAMEIFVKPCFLL